MSVVAIITARGGSKRIPRKNIKHFHGKPIIAFSIEAALKSKLFDEVMVSTDDGEIASLAQRYGASIPFMRSSSASNDFATTSDVLHEVIAEYKKIGREFERFCCLYPAAPFVTPGKLEKASNILSDENVEAVVPVVRFDFPPQRGFIIEKGNLTYLNPEFERVRSQDIEPLYHDAGQFYFCKTSAFLECGSLIPKKTSALVLSADEVQDIDSIEDWKIAEIKYSLMIEREILE